MTDSTPTTMPAPTFPRLYDPDRVEELADVEARAALSEPFPLPEGTGYEPPKLFVATAGAFGPQYLVLLQGASEDVPLGLFEDRDEAVAFARAVRDNPDDHAGRYLSVIGRDPSFFRPRWLAVRVVEFEGPVPAASAVLFDLD